ncbi:polysaccharide deacetylase [Haladaptatus paucihalophilus DX253]|uniref:Polysaccharide deacetylase n=1 Tax=Haladaptatus paucihalophilus DX253 TaxID=797209 RepID=E7QX46_HALPU|nr:polysaccharide deacetylase family protein [Haladaptatus paucihalophilus]EFW90849.1 polysaccharide deacetylase [Haladaptatus paucihalophilus DX253]SHK23858.1 Polysaccharide deacetylase [Haladaptatus paucihalophilus DX253]
MNRTRRRLLHLSGTGLIGFLAGCSNDGTGDTTEHTSSPPTSSGTSESTATTASTETTTTEQPSSLHTKYDSRKRFASPGTSFETFEDPARWRSLEGEMTPDSKTKHTGSQSLRLVGRGGHHVIIERRLSGTMNFTDRDVSAMIRTTTPSKIGFYVYLVDTDGNKAALELRDISYRPPDIGWFRTCPGVFEADEKLDLRTIDRILLQVTNGTADDVKAWVDDVRFHPKPDKGYVILSWDDGKRSYYENAAPLHDEYGYPAVLTHPPNLAGLKRDAFMSLEELKERESKGDEVVAHGSSQFPFSETSASKLDGILETHKQWLIDHEFSGADFIVYPGNNFDETALDVVSNYHYMGGMNQSGNVNTTGVCGFDPLVLPRTIGNDLEISKTVVDNVATYRNCGILNFHDFESSNTMSISDYGKLLSHIDGIAGVEVITFSDLWGMRTNTAP